MVRKLLIETVFESIIFLEHDILDLVNVGVSQLAGRFGTSRGEVCQGSGTNSATLSLLDPLQKSSRRPALIKASYFPAGEKTLLAKRK